MVREECRAESRSSARGGRASGLDSKLSRGRPRESLFAGRVVGRVRASEGGADAYLGPSGDPFILRGGDLRRKETREASARGRVARERRHAGSPSARMLVSATPGRVSNEARGGTREARAGGRRTWTGWSYLTSELMGGIGMVARRRSRPPVLPSRASRPGVRANTHPTVLHFPRQIKLAGVQMERRKPPRVFFSDWSPIRFMQIHARGPPLVRPHHSFAPEWRASPPPNVGGGISWRRLPRDARGGHRTHRRAKGSIVTLSRARTETRGGDSLVAFARVDATRARGIQPSGRACSTPVIAAERRGAGPAVRGLTRRRGVRLGIEAGRTRCRTPG